MSSNISELWRNVVLWTAVTSWFTAQLIKFIIELYKHKKFDLFLFIGSGGMPSSHSSFVTAITIIIGFKDGFGSTLFAISAAISLVVMYDATGVRQAAGKQAVVLNMLIEHLNDPNISLDKKLRELLGHTPVEVAAGALLGIVIGACSANFFRLI